MEHKWEIIGLSVGLRIRDKDGLICSLPKPFHYHGQDERYEEELAKTGAIAKLIAAAPETERQRDELLITCKAMYEALAILEGYDDITAKAKKAIANATNP